MQLIIPILTLLVVASCTVYAFIAQESLAEHSTDIIRILIYVIGIVGTGFVSLMVYTFSKLAQKVDENSKATLQKLDQIGKDINQINVRCATFNHFIPLSPPSVPLKTREG